MKLLALRLSRHTWSDVEAWRPPGSRCGHREPPRSGFSSVSRFSEDLVLTGSLCPRRLQSDLGAAKLLPECQESPIAPNSMPTHRILVRKPLPSCTFPNREHKSATSGPQSDFRKWFFYFFEIFPERPELPELAHVLHLHT